jgi:hypothetical protein
VTEYWFDTREGSLLIGRDAAQERIDEGGPDILPFRDILEGEALPEIPDYYDKIDARKPALKWSREDYIAAGRMVVRALDPEHHNIPVRWQHIQRLAQLGLSPALRSFRRHFELLSTFRNEVGSMHHFQTRTYEHWTFYDYVEYVGKVLNELNRKPMKADFAERSKRGEGPDYGKISQKANLRKVYEHLGIPDLQSWEDEDALDWGVKVKMANNGIPLNPYVIHALSQRNRGPSLRYLDYRQGGLVKFDSRVTEQYFDQIASDQQLREARLKQYRQMAESGRLPNGFSGLDADRLLKAAPRALLIEAIAPGIPEAKKAELAQGHLSGITYTLLNYESGLTPGHIESTAIRLDIFDEIWPLDQYKRHLKVTDAEIKNLKRKQSEKRKQYKKLRQADAEAA